MEALRLIFSLGATIIVKRLHSWDWANGIKQIRQTLARKIEIFNSKGKEGNVKTLQHLARNNIRETLAAGGYDIRPKIQCLELPRVLKCALVSFD